MPMVGEATKAAEREILRWHLANSSKMAEAVVKEGGKLEADALRLGKQAVTKVERSSVWKTLSDVGSLVAFTARGLASQALRGMADIATFAEAYDASAWLAKWSEKVAPDLPKIHF